MTSFKKWSDVREEHVARALEERRNWPRPGA